MLYKTLRVVAYKGTPGNPKETPRDLIHPGDKNCTLDADKTVEIYIGGKCICIDPTSTTISVSDVP
jgi:hypothetical protein